MNLLISILRAAHCRSSHHFFAIDACSSVQTQRGKRLRSVLLKHHARYLAGAKDPDTKFRDFRNHVVHVNDGHWGGAAKQAEAWYQNLVNDLDARQWSDAAYSAGVLSHYFTDPLMPLHTAQSDIESVVHRPMEWSVVKSYQRILSRWQAGNHKIVFDIPTAAGWLTQAVRRGAEVANRYYDELIKRYDLDAGVRKPIEGFDDQSIDILAGLFGLAITGWAKILERAADETKSEIPDMPLTAASLLATIQMPTAWITRKIESRQERAAVQAILDEYRTTGKVEHNKPAEVISVAEQRERDRQREQQNKASQVRQRSAPSEPLRTPQVSAASHPKPPSRTVASSSTTSRSRQPGLALTDDLVDAPSIGPKTAKRFAAIGITTVEQFLGESAERMQTLLKTSWITAEKLTQWQAQARLVCAIPSLCGYKSQLLVAVGCSTTDAVAHSSPDTLHRDIARFAETTAGKRILRSSKTPDIDDVKEWVADAAAVVTRMSA